MGKGEDYNQVGATAVSALPVATAVVPQAVVSPTQMVNVMSPADLPAGYTFEAEVNGTRFPVVVPSGGVKQGQQFTVPMPTAQTASATHDPRTMGRWKDGLCHCCAHGPCHPSFCLTFWCRLCALGQVMTRMRLNWLASPGSVSEVARTFRNTCIVTVIYFAADFVLESLFASMVPAGAIDDPYNNTNVSAEAMMLYHAQRALELAFGLYVMIATCRTRQKVRQHYQIPEDNCSGCEDLCCAAFCSCCSISQMLRHTADYQKYPGKMCSETGLPPHAPQTIV